MAALLALIGSRWPPRWMAGRWMGVRAITGEGVHYRVHLRIYERDVAVWSGRAWSMESVLSVLSVSRLSRRAGRAGQGRHGTQGRCEGGRVRTCTFPARCIGHSRHPPRERLIESAGRSIQGRPASVASRQATCETELHSCCRPSAPSASCRCGRRDLGR
jgi:hypothetical protein